MQLRTCGKLVSLWASCLPKGGDENRAKIGADRRRRLGSDSCNLHDRLLSGVGEQPHSARASVALNVPPHGVYVIFQMAEVTVPRQMFPEILRPIARLRAPPAPA